VAGAFSSLPIQTPPVELRGFAMASVVGACRFAVAWHVTKTSLAAIGATSSSSRSSTLISLLVARELTKYRENRLSFARLTQIGDASQTLSLFTIANIFKSRDDDHWNR